MFNLVMSIGKKHHTLLKTQERVFQATLIITFNITIWLLTQQNYIITQYRTNEVRSWKKKIRVFVFRSSVFGLWSSVFGLRFVDAHYWPSVSEVDSPVSSIRKKLSHRKLVHHNPSIKYASRWWAKRKWFHVHDKKKFPEVRANRALKRTTTKQWNSLFLR